MLNKDSVWPDCGRKEGEEGRDEKGKGGEGSKHAGTTETREGPEGEQRAHLQGPGKKSHMLHFQGTQPSPVPDAHPTGRFRFPHQPGQSLVTHTVHASKGESGVAQSNLLLLEPLPSPPLTPLHLYIPSTWMLSSCRSCSDMWENLQLEPKSHWPAMGRQSLSAQEGSTSDRQVSEF